MSGQPAAASARSTVFRAVARARVRAVRSAAGSPVAQPNVYGPPTGCLTARSVSLAVACQPFQGVVPAGRAAVGDRLEAGRLLGPHGDLDQGLERCVLGERWAGQGSQERREHRLRPPAIPSHDGPTGILAHHIARSDGPGR